MPKRLVLVRKEGRNVVILDRERGVKFLTEDPACKIVQSVRQEGRLPLDICQRCGISSAHKVYEVGLPAFNLSPVAKSFPSRMYFGLNNFCNLRCRQCFVENDKPAPRVKLTRVGWEPVLDVVDRYGLVELRLGESGEPTIDPPLLTDFLTDAKRKGFYISLTTNGQFDSSWVNVWAALVDQPIISIDGDKNYHDWNRGEGTFEKALEKLRLFSGKVKELRVNTIFSRRALEGLEVLIKHCVECHVDELCLLQLRPYKRGRRHWRDILTPEEWKMFITKTLPHYREVYPRLRIRADYDISGVEPIDRLVDKVRQCSAGMEAFGIRPYRENDHTKLKVYGCGYLVEEAEEFEAARLTPQEFGEGFFELWHTDSAWEVFRKPRYQSEECTMQCPHYGDTCFGKCVALLRYAEIEPGFAKYIQCPFAAIGKLSKR